MEGNNSEERETGILTDKEMMVVSNVLSQMH